MNTTEGAAVGAQVDRPVGRQRHVIGARPTCGGPVEWHARGGGVGGGDYTLCGVSVDGDEFAPVPGNNRITCRECRSVWLASRLVRAVDFAA